MIMSCHCSSQLGNHSAIATSDLYGYSYVFLLVSLYFTYVWIGKHHDVGVYRYFSVLVRWSCHSKGLAHVVRLC